MRWPKQERSLRGNGARPEVRVGAPLYAGLSHDSGPSPLGAPRVRSFTGTRSNTNSNNGTTLDFTGYPLTASPETLGKTLLRYLVGAKVAALSEVGNWRMTATTSWTQQKQSKKISSKVTRRFNSKR